MSSRSIMCIDVESNGLYGRAFCVGAVVIDGEDTHSFRARCPIDGDTHPWVAEHVLPVLVDVDETHDDLRLMAMEFARWFAQHSNACDVFVDCGYPVEMNFFEEVRAADHRFEPYPIHEVSTMFLAAGMDPDFSRDAFLLLRDNNVGEGSDECRDPKYGRKHDPLSDALVSARCVVVLRRKEFR
jgi:hypothetical protein